MATEAPNEPGFELADLFPAYDTEFLRELTHQLTYIQHGGSGLGWTRAEVLDCDLDEALWHRERLVKAREDEAKAIKVAQARAARRR